MKYEPYFYQDFAEQFILDNAAAGLFLDMGMGKTAITLTAIEKLMRDSFEVVRVLVIAPLKPAKETWPPEIKKWDHLNGLSASLVLGSESERLEALRADADIYIVNRENVSWLVNHYRKRWPFDMVVIDELSSFKSSKAVRFRELKKVRKYIKRMVGLKHFHDEKLNKLEQLIEEANGQPVLVFYAYKHERDRILEKFPEAVDVKEDNAVPRWNAGSIPILLAHPASAGHGLNMQFGGHIAVWYNFTGSLELYQQANKRLHRPGQKETVLIHHILVKGGFDVHILDDVLSGKEQTQDALINALRAIIKEVYAA